MTLERGDTEETDLSLTVTSALLHSVTSATDLERGGTLERGDTAETVATVLASRRGKKKQAGGGARHPSAPRIQRSKFGRCFRHFGTLRALERALMDAQRRF